MLKDLLDRLEEKADGIPPCRLFQVAESLDQETREIFIRSLLNQNISGRAMHGALRSEGIVIDKALLNKQRKCMRTNECTCDWDSLS